MSTVKCKLLEISHYTDYINDNEAIVRAILKDFSNWEEISLEEYHALVNYVYDLNAKNVQKGWNGLPEERAKYLILLREPSPDLTARTIKEMIAAKEAARIKAEEDKKKREEAKEKARIANEEKKAAAKRKKLEKQIKDLENLKKELEKTKV